MYDPFHHFHSSEGGGLSGSQDLDTITVFNSESKNIFKVFFAH